MSGGQVRPLYPAPAGSVASSGGGPYDPKMEIRMVRLEDQFSRIEILLKGIDDRVRAVELELRESKGRMSNLPTTWAMIATVVGGQVGLVALLFTALKLGLKP